jgi:hypothetical protein
VNHREFKDVFHIIWYLPSARSVGEVRNYASDLKHYRRIGISLGDDVLKKMKGQFLMTEWTSAGPKIRVSTAFMAIPRSLREAGIWHEVGHIHLGHRYCDEIGNRAEFGTTPMAIPDQAARQVMEEAADHFAVIQSSKDALKGFLEYLLHARPSALRGGWSEIERRELVRRISSIRLYGRHEYETR